MIRFISKAPCRRITKRLVQTSSMLLVLLASIVWKLWQHIYQFYTFSFGNIFQSNILTGSMEVTARPFLAVHKKLISTCLLPSTYRLGCNNNPNPNAIRCVLLFAMKLLPFPSIPFSTQRHFFQSSTSLSAECFCVFVMKSHPS